MLRNARRRLGHLLEWFRGRPVTSAVIAVALAAVLVPSGVYGYERVTDTSCGEGVERRGDDRECTGVTDGRYAFMGSLAGISRRIEEENDRVAGRPDPYVTVALMIPMVSGTAVVRQQILHEVQGAYLAQRKANRADKAPPIRLVLANPGAGSRRWRPVADQLKAMADSPRHRLRAVIGFDLSVRNTREAIAYLTNDLGLPVVGGPITADTITNTDPDHPRFPGLARVVPTNGDQVEALIRYRDDRPEDTFLVEDVREGDDYVKTLREAFEKKRETARDAPEPERYASSQSADDEVVLPNDFTNIVQNICQSGAHVVYFAGRPAQLRMLINELGRHTCDRTKNTYTIVTGSGASTVDSDAKLDWDALRHGVTVQYASVAHPDAWSRKDAPRTGGSPEATADLAAHARALGNADLDDSRTISTYDAALTAVAAIRNQSIVGRRIPSPVEVARGWLRLRGVDRVEGASGWICLDNTGSAYDKAVHIVELNPDGRSSGRTLRFVDLAWPEGKPLDERCTAPARRTR